MPRPKNKEELKIAAETNYKKLLTLIEGRSEAETGTDYDFSADEKKICRKMTKSGDKDRFICYWLYHLLKSLDLGGYTNDRCTGHSAIFWHYKMLQRL